MLCPELIVWSAEHFSSFRQAQQRQQEPHAYSSPAVDSLGKHVMPSIGSPTSPKPAKGWHHRRTDRSSHQPSWYQTGQEANNHVSRQSASAAEHQCHPARPSSFAEDVAMPQEKDIDLAQQQQRMIDLLKLRSDELSSENGKLRLQVAATGQQHLQSMQHVHADSAMQPQLMSRLVDSQPSMLSRPADCSSFKR